MTKLCGCIVARTTVSGTLSVAILPGAPTAAIFGGMFAFPQCVDCRCNPCAPGDPTTDTVKVKFGSFEEKENVRPLTKQGLSDLVCSRYSEHGRAELARRAAEDRARAEMEELARLDAHRLLEQEAALARAAEEEAARLEHEAREEQRRRQCLREEKEEEARARERVAEEWRRREAEEAAMEQQLLEEDAKVATFLQKHGFRGVNEKRSRLLSSTLPLHTAVAQNNADMVRLLLARGGDQGAKISGQTPLQLAQKLSRTKKGNGSSYVEVLKALGDANPACM